MAQIVNGRDSYYTPAEDRATYYREIVARSQRKDWLVGVRDHYDVIVIGGGLAGG